MKLIALNLVAILMTLSACYLAVENKDGWGWFLFGAIVCCGSSYSSTETKD